MKKWRRYVPAGVLVLVLAVTVMLTFTVKAEKTEDGVIPDKVYFGTINGSGLTQEQAAEEIEAYVEQLMKTEITLTAGENTLKVTAEELGLYWSNPEIVEEAACIGKSGNLIARYKDVKDLEQEDRVYTIGFSVDTAKVTEVLKNGLETLNKKTVDTGLKRENGKFVVVAGSQGINVKVEESVETIESFFAALWKEADATIVLVTEVEEPRGSEEELSKVKDVLGAFTTNFSSGMVARTKNIKRGTEIINGTVLYPGDEFSVTGVCAPYTKENGYEMAGAFENGQHVQSYGGGMCQVSTTLYNAVIRAELEITERFAHSMTVAYVDQSADAAIAGTWKDLKFVNNTEAPVYIEGYTNAGQLIFNIYGQETRDANRVVSYVSEITEQTDPGIVFNSVSDPVGTVRLVQSVHLGIKAQLWKIVTVDGVEVSKEIFNKSSYNPAKAIYEVGVSSSNAEAVAAIKAAIATNDLAKIKETAAYWSDEAIAARQQPQNQGATGSGDQTADPAAAGSGD